MLEYWYKERRSLVDFRRGPLGPIFDGFAAWLKERGYSQDTGRAILGKCCLFNSYLIDQGVTKCKNITPAHREAFLDCHLADFRTTSGLTNQRAALKGQLNRLCQYLVENKIICQAACNFTRKIGAYFYEGFQSDGLPPVERSSTVPSRSARAIFAIHRSASRISLSNSRNR